MFRRFAEDPDVPLLGPDETEDDLEEGGLPPAVWAHEPHERSLLYVHRDPVEDGSVFVDDRDVLELDGLHRIASDMTRRLYRMSPR